MKVVVSLEEAREIVMKALIDANRLPEDCNIPDKFHAVDVTKPVEQQVTADLFTFSFTIDVENL